MLNELANEVHQMAKSKGFYDNVNIGEKLCLVHSEVSEALEADRKKHYTQLHKDWYIKGLANPDFGETFCDNMPFIKEFENSVKNTFEDELADVIIRVLELCAFKGIDIESHIKAKMRYNSMREHKHGKAY